ncbi:Iron-sulfur clusters incorporation protein [Homalodisca vitripennis]|nr:Iron-sulfur clusters incorporation protein [Homalodisca vitripennis]KAG8320323.1 Iron-sulfur clusters incorporation protein [Homalodisca vitripennis]
MILNRVKLNRVRSLMKTEFTNVFNKTHQRLLNISCQAELLKTRGLVRVSGGDDVLPFLQGIVTNDMRHLQENGKSLFSMFLNTKGRVLYDSIIYKTNEENTYFVECDSQGLSDLVRHLKMYRVRRKINIDSIDNEYKVWALFNPISIEISTNTINSLKQEQIVPCTLPNLEDKAGLTFLNDLVLDSALVYADPRLSSLGSRVIAPDGENIVDAVQKAGVKVETSSPYSYRMFRYRLGVGEGTEELPIGKCFPLEVNCDYLHGVSFHKGCYIGQELTARTHHTGVVRKRLMPLLLESEVTSGNFPVDTPIEAAAGDRKTAIGKLRGVEKNCALGLMRIAEALEVHKLKVRNIEGETVRPFWWPQELSKERVDTGRS